jgi:Fe-S cluster assembly iron-binding protein IscA
MQQKSPTLWCDSGSLSYVDGLGITFHTSLNFHNPNSITYTIKATICEALQEFL